jgi:hypothetical protein
LRRLHLFELEDQRWFPALLRDAGTAYLRLVLELSGHAKLLLPKLREALERSGEKSILDLCSGGGGAIPVVVSELAAAGLDVRARLTDYYPNTAAFRALAAASSGRIDYVAEPVDATDVPSAEPGLRTLWNAFHHFRPRDARKILAGAVRTRRPIAVFEVVGRQLLPILGILLSPLQVLLLWPLVRPVRASWLFFTYVVPAIPLLVLWDGLVSCLRVYSPTELRELASSIDAPGWTWDIGRIRLGRAPAHATYLVAYPPAATPSR